MLIDNELTILEFWKKNNIFQKAKNRRKNGPKFYMCDGPPFATGGIHIGTAWNKSLKDAICRYKMMQGYDVYIRAGYDTHGLPIETQVERELGIKDKKEIETKVGIDIFVKRCKELCEKYIDLMSEQFVRLGTWMDFDDPYITYKNDFIEKTWKTLQTAYDKGLLYNDLHVNAHCPRCQTTMANYELEYKDLVDPAIFVKFKIEKKENSYLVVWTTTPWTLVGNVAVMANPLIKYVRAKVGDEEWIFAKDRIKAVEEAANESIIIIKEFSGKELVNYRYHHPLKEETGRTQLQQVVMSDEFVTTEDGSGLVHCAPGHGPEDFIIGKRYGLEIFCPVGPDGKYTELAGEYEGKSVLEINDSIIERLKEKNLLINAAKITHSYPTCWRCKTKLIHISSKQWFIKITGIKDKMRSELAKTIWMPDFAGKWMSNFVEDAKDWCISRQRYWGIPLPIWKCENDKCEELKVIGSSKELHTNLKDLHRPEIDAVTFKCSKCKSKMRRVPDVLDVWFDSGNAIWAGLKDGDEKYYPSDMIIEGKDQIRGWFYSLLGSGVVLNNEIPYNSLLMHGYVVDDKGNAMHKSLGNYVPWEEVISKYPADAIRLMALSNTTWDDLRFNWNEIEEAKNELMIIANINTYLERFYNRSSKKQKMESVEDLWFRSKLNSLVKEVTEHMERGESFNALRKIRSFLIQDTSRFYMKLIKKREDINLLYEGFFTVMLLASPFIPFTTEGIYQKNYLKSKKKKSIFLHEWPKANENRIDRVLEKEVEIAKELAEVCNSLRVTANIKLRWPLEEVVLVTRSTDITNAVKHTDKIVRMLANIRNVRIEEHENIILSDAINNELDEKTVKAIKELKLNDEGKFLKGMIEIEGNKIDYSKFITVDKKGYVSRATQYGMILLKTEIDPTLKAEGIMSEIRRRIQSMRKEMKLVEKDRIEVFVKGSEEINRIIKDNGTLILGEINAKEINIGTGGKVKKTWNIDDEMITIGITQLE